MDWQAIADAATAAGAAAGLVALAWNATAEIVARRRRNSARIEASLRGRVGTGELLTVKFHRAESHTSYVVTVSCRQPRALQARSGEGWGDSMTQPFSLQLTSHGTEPGTAQARALIFGFTTQDALKLTFVVRERFGSRVVARRTLAMVIT